MKKQPKIPEKVAHKSPKPERKLELKDGKIVLGRRKRKVEDDSNLKDEKGITLIALVITVVIILILAGISIVMLTGDNSILKNAQRAKLETEKAQVVDKVKLSVTASYDKNGDFDDEQVKKELEKEKIDYIELPDEIDVKLPDGSHMIIDKETGKIDNSSDSGATQYTLTVKYYSNTGVGEMEEQKINWSEEAALAENKFSKEGYIFSGWSKDEGGEKVYDPIETIKNTTKKKNDVLNLYAVWTPSSYGITYELNGGELDAGRATYGVYDTEVVVGNPTKEGYGFAGWTISGMTNSNHLIGDKTSSAESVSEIKDTRFKNLRNEVGTVTFTAVWTANTNTIYTVEHYQMNTSGSYPESPTATQNLLGTSDATLTLANLKENYTGFAYSYGQVNGKTETTTTVLANGSRVVKLYYSRNIYTISYNLNGGTGNVPASHTEQYERNATIKFDKIPTKVEAVFLGWSENAYATSPTYTSAGKKSLTIGAKNVTLYAIWHNHNNACYSTLCKGTFSRWDSTETYFTCSHQHEGNSTSGGKCYTWRNCTGTQRISWYGDRK